MIVFDTDHLSILQHTESVHCERLLNLMRASSHKDFAATIVSLEEQMRAWLAAIRRARSQAKQTPLYDRLLDMLEFFRKWRLLRYDELAAAEFDRLRKQGIRIGAMDLKIAAIALVHSARLVTSNLRDFGKVPGLVVEDWLKLT